jgi:uncharacterized protein YukE
MELVTGDPASMRAAAAQLRFRAETLTTIAANVEAGVAGMTYAGPAADQFHSTIATQGNALRAVCARMASTADTLARQAAIVEEAQLRQASQGQA